MPSKNCSPLIQTRPGCRTRMALLASPDVGIRGRAFLDHASRGARAAPETLWRAGGCRRIPAFTGRLHPWLAVALGEGWRLPRRTHSNRRRRPTIRGSPFSQLLWSLSAIGRTRRGEELGIWSFRVKGFASRGLITWRRVSLCLFPCPWRHAWPDSLRCSPRPGAGPRCAQRHPARVPATS